MKSPVHHVKTAVNSTVDTRCAVNLAVVHVMSVHCLVAGLVLIINVNFPVISRVSDLRVIVRVTIFCRVDIVVLDSVESRAFHSAASAIAR